MTTTKTRTRMLALLLALLAVLSLLPMTAFAASIEDGSATCTIAPVERHHFLRTTAGTTLGASAYQYTTNDGLSGPGYCIDHGLNYASHALPIVGKYSVSPKTAGAFANGYPQHDVATFLGLYLSRNPILEGLTETEFGYATQLAIWATLGQLAIEGTPFSSGRETVAQPTGDTQQMRVFRAVQLICAAANTWDRIYQTGMYIRTQDNALGGNISIPADMTLEFAADEEQYGIKREVIDGNSYYTIEYTFASATSTYYSGYNMELWADGAPAGYMYTDMENHELEHSTFREHSTWRLPVTQKPTNLNGNGFEYSAKAKLCIPVDIVPNSGEITVRCGAYVAQYQIYLAKNEIVYEQSFIIADPSKGTMESNAVINWGGVLTETGSLQVTKVDGGGTVLEGASFTLTGTDGSSRTGRTDANGIILWEQLDPSVTYTLTETEAPAGYSIVDPVNIRIKAARTNFVTVQDSPQKQLSVKKVDKQSGYSLGGCVIAFEQIDGTFYTTATTDQAGLIQMDAEQLPVGSYKVYEVTAPEGYELDDTVQTVHWDGKRDITLTFNNVRKPTIIIYKCDEDNNYALNGASFEVYKDGTLFTTVSTNDNGLAYVPGVTTGYYIVKEVVAPAGYVLDSTEHGIYVNNYDPATTEDPRIVIKNSVEPQLRIIKYDAQTMRPLPDTTFEVYRDAVLIGQYTTNAAGEILLYDLEPGTYLVKEIVVAPGYVVNSTPQQIEIEAGRTNYELVFLNLLKPGIHLVKLDAETMQPLANAKFRISQVGGMVKGAGSAGNEYVTDANGEVDLTGLEPGTYVVEEIEAPDGYLIDDSQRIIEINPGETALFVFTDTRKPSITVVKYDANLDKKLPGATFRVSNIEDGSHYLDRITGMDGSFTIENLEPGVYSVIEMDAPAGYVKNGTEFHVELFAGRNSQLVVNNEAKPDLKIIKKDADTGDLLPGAVFTVQKADSSTVTTERTNANGEILLEDMEPGVYKITESAPPEGYLPAENPTQMITLVPNKLGTVVFENHSKPTITVNKIDAVTGDPIKGARFQVLFASSNTFTGEINDLGYYYSDENGQFKLTELRDGWYRVKEIAPAAGYAIKDSDTQDFYVDGGKSKVITFENTPLSAIVIIKVDAATGEPLQGAWFRVRYLGGTSGTGGTTIGEYQTSVNGSAVITGLHAGTYIVEEISAPHGYVLSENSVQTVYLSGKNQDVVTVSFGNAAKGSLMIKKIDSESRAPLSDVEFLVSYSDGAVVGNANGHYTTDAAGTILIDDLEPGVTVIAKEITAKRGYLLDDTPQTIKIKSGETVTLEFRNQPKGTLIIEKFDSVTKLPLSGAKFKITTSAGTFVPDAEGHISSNGIYTTDENGQIILSAIEPDTYIVTETEAPANYKPETGSKSIEVRVSDTQTLRFFNEPYCTLTLRKQDAVTKNGLMFAEFTVKYSDGRYVGPNNGKYVTGRDGAVIVSGLEPNATVIVTETKAPSGYIGDEQPQTIVVRSGAANSLTFDNEPTTTLIIRKFIEGTDYEPLAGVAFKVIDGSGAAVGPDDGVYYTDNAGEIVLSGLEPGTVVKAREIKTVDGFVLDGTPQDIEIKEGTVQQLTFWNQRQGALTIRKLDSVTKQPIEGVTFKVTTATGAFLPDASGKISSNGLYYTDRAGEIVITGFTGTLVVTEVETVAGYTIHEATRSQTVVVNPEDTQVLTFYNDPTQSVVIQKYISGTTTPLPGVTFLITYGNGMPVGGGNGEYVTDSNGRIIITGLPAGTTIVAKEIRTVKGYALNPTPQTITVTGNLGQTVTVPPATVIAGNGGQMTFYDDQLNTLTIHKYVEGTRNEPLVGVEFKVTDGSGAAVGTNNGVYYTDRSGDITIRNLEAGTTITVRETRTVDGYVLDSTPQTIEIKGNGENNELTFWNSRQGTLVIKKLDSVTKEPLAGVEFSILYADGRYVDAEGGKLSSNGIYTTDSNGEIRISGLTGTIVVTEEKTLPGYTIDEGTRKQTVVVRGNETQTLTFYNSPAGGLQIIKSDEDTGERIKGVQFEIRKVNGEIIGTYTTDRRGVISIPSAESGWYTITELKAAKGYELDVTPEYACVKDGQTTTVEITNKRMCSLMIHKVDADTGKGIYGVTFILYDSGKNPIGEYVTDQNGYVYIADELEAGRYYLRELEAADGYTLDTQYKTIWIERGKCAQIEWENKAITGQIQVRKYSSEANTITGTPAGALLPGAVYEITQARSGSVVGYIVTDARGVAASEPLPLGRYYLTEVTAPKYYQLSGNRLEAEIEYAGQIIRLSDYDKPVQLGVSIKKTGNVEAQPGTVIRYDFTGIANTSNVALNNYFWHDRIPTDATTAVSLTTGTYNQRLYYRVAFKTNLSDYRVLASNLLTSNNYSINLTSNALGLAQGEYVTDVRLEFGTVASGFASSVKPTLQVKVNDNVSNSYKIINRADVGGQYLNEWQTATTSWVTTVYRFENPTPLPKTGY